MQADDPISLLFVDGDTAYMAAVQHLLGTHKERKFAVHWRQHAQATLEFLAAGPRVDLVLLDYYLPERNGLDLAREIREAEIDVPVAFLTSYRDFSLALRGLRLGIVDYIVKEEVSDADLPGRIIATVERVRARRETGRRQKEEHVRDQQKQAIRELVVTICHEFNNPLAAVKISTDILLRQDLPPREREIVERLERNIELVEREITRLREVTFDSEQREDATPG